MRLVTFDAGQGDRLGIWREDGSVADLSASGRPAFASMLALIGAGPEALEAAGAEAARAPTAESARLRAPIPLPPQMRDFMAFEKHVAQAIRTMARRQARAAGMPEDQVTKLAPPVPEIWYRQPVYYKCNRFAVSGPDEDIPRPAYSTRMDYECELACVLGRGGRDIPKDRARDHIFGLTIFNDFSARDAQAVEMAGMLGPAKGKDFDKANAMGPCIVPLADIGDPFDLPMIVRVNGTEVSRGNSGEAHWRFEEIIEWVSRGETLHPGEILGSGTVGDGCGLEHDRYLSDGDAVELEIPPIGVLRNRLVAP